MLITAGTTYKKQELSEIFGNSSVQAMKRKLARYGISFNTSGRGEQATFEILEIADRFKVFCIIELKVAANTDFPKLRNFYYYFFNDDEFRSMPDEVKEYRMMECGKPVSRQTIAHYTQKLIDQGWVWQDHYEFIYYFAYKNTQRITTRKEYSQAWKNYWQDKENGLDSIDAIGNMIICCGGVARKQAKIEANAFYLTKINELCDLIQESFEKETENQNIVK